MSENLASALAAFQLELPTLGKSNTAKVTSDKGNYTYKYADLADVSSVVLPLLAKHGLSFSAKPTIDEGGRFVLAYALRHVSGEVDTGAYPLVTGTPQQVGSAITYARRYALCAVTGVAPDKDDDGEGAADTRHTTEPHRPQWDPVEQDVLRAGWEAEIADAASTEEITDIGKKILAAKRAGELSGPTYERLAKAGAARKAELNGATT